MNKNTVLTGGLMFMIAIILGAFGAHGLKEKISMEDLQTFEVGVRYQFYQGIAILALGLSADKIGFSLKTPAMLMTIGTLFFSVSIYFLAIQDLLGAQLKFLGPITPIGGLLMIIGWSIFLWKLVRSKA
jgi:uncharacterized membrane protein YgdD (TMEM256/DUF423 family)